MQIIPATRIIDAICHLFIPDLFPQQIGNCIIKSVSNSETFCKICKPGEIDTCGIWRSIHLPLCLFSNILAPRYLQY